MNAGIGERARFAATPRSIVDLHLEHDLLDEASRGVADRPREHQSRSLTNQGHLECEGRVASTRVGGGHGRGCTIAESFRCSGESRQPAKRPLHGLLVGQGERRQSAELEDRHQLALREPPRQDPLLCPFEDLGETRVRVERLDGLVLRDRGRGEQKSARRVHQEGDPGHRSVGTRTTARPSPSMSTRWSRSTSPLRRRLTRCRPAERLRDKGE